ncbi:GIY-YIG nuclease family protein [Snodgrassella sp. CFCC 13594]|uniref:GIY-YIG nuclease family protein n=1 Tax=Snodgrassella sp. CFCC 13594 TaxID=1775559 RepID=UPI00082DF005|nr:GIY-YIG nuclease family protein [Snodgrassella sp. CFCC 13594]
METVTRTTIKIFLLYGDPKKLRIGEISNWTGKAVAGPRVDIEQILQRPEAEGSGVYILTGTDPDSGSTAAYIGEAESIKVRLKQHVSKEFWNHAVFFVSKDENLTKAHIRYLESQMIVMARTAGRMKLMNVVESSAKLPESDIADMAFFIEKMKQLLPPLGMDLFVPIHPSVSEASQANKSNNIENEIFGGSYRKLKAEAKITANGVVVLKGSQAAIQERNSARDEQHWVKKLRAGLIQSGVLASTGESYLFTEDYEFSSPSAAAAVIVGGNQNGREFWKNSDFVTLKALEEQEIND